MEERTSFGHVFEAFFFVLEATMTTVYCIIMQLRLVHKRSWRKGDVFITH